MNDFKQSVDFFLFLVKQTSFMTFVKILGNLHSDIMCSEVMQF